MLSDLMGAFETGALRPLPLKAFPLADAVAGFRYMAQAKHIGKVVITQSRREPAGPAETRIRPDGTYLVTGGRGGLGLHVARALMARNGGDLELRNRIGGTTFVLSLPASEDQRTPPVVPRWETVHQF